MSNTTFRKLPLVVLATALVLSACAGDDAPESAPVEQTGDAQITKEPTTVDSADESSEEVAEAEPVAEEPTTEDAALTDEELLGALAYTWDNTSAERRAVVCEEAAHETDEEVVQRTQAAIDANVGDLSGFTDVIVGFWTERCIETLSAQEFPNYQVGELIESPSADITVNALEERDSIPAPNSGSFYPSGAITPGEGERLWYVDITWTNNSTQAVGKECHGPYSMDLQAFDRQGRQMLMVDQPGMIDGQNCSTGLMQGQTGTWLSAFHGLDEDFGWLVFSDYEGGEHVVVLDADLQVSPAN